MNVIHRDGCVEVYAANPQPNTGKPIAIFSGPDREANAALFIRAQHMDDLELEVRKLCAYVEDLPTEEMVSGMPIVKRIDDILSKIEGGK